MALPKGKISKARKHSRRANWKLTLPRSWIAPSATRRCWRTASARTAATITALPSWRTRKINKFAAALRGLPFGPLKERSTP